MNVRKKPKRAKGPQVFAINAPAAEVPLEVCLESAIMAHFQRDRVRCEVRAGTSPRTRGKLVVELSRFDGTHLPPMLMRSVSAFIAGYMACEGSYAGP